MAPKTWIKIKTGLSRDAKHREQMGVCVWLFMHMLDKANWETGAVYGWKDADEAEAMSMPLRTLRDQRQKLEDSGYITCLQRFQSQDLIIHNWTNPREYSGQVYNPKHGDNTMSPSENTDDHGDTHGDTHGSRKDVTPSLRSQITDHTAPDGAGLSTFQETKNITPHVYTIPEGLSAKKEKTLEFDCREHCGGRLTVQDDRCPKCQWPAVWENSRWRGKQAHNPRADLETQRQRALARAKAATDAADYLLAQAQASDPGCRAWYLTGENQAVRAYEARLGTGFLRGVIDEFLAAGEFGRGLISHVLNRLSYGSRQDREVGPPPPQFV